MLIYWKLRAIENKLNHYSYSKGINLGLERINSLLDKLGNPHLKIPVIHIAGTNGKGSTTILTSNALSASGYKVGAYLSPHLISYRERFLLNGIQISSQDFVDTFEEVFTASKQIKEVTAFEIMTAMAFCYFANQQVDVAVMETGMGGRYDATNVCRSILTIITPISLDHQNFLGDNLKSIAREKAGIIKKDTPVVTANQPTKAMSEIVKEVESKDNPLFVIGYPIKYKLPFSGISYRYNAALSMKAILELRTKGIYIHRHTILNGFAKSKLPGRYQIISKRPLTIIDSAHNAGGFQSLVENLENDYLIYKKIWIIGLKIDKDLHKIALQLRGSTDTLIVTNLNSNSSYNSKQLAKFFNEKGFRNIYAISKPTKAYKLAKKLSNNQSIIVIAGSFLLSGELMKSLRIPVSYFDG